VLSDAEVWIVTGQFDEALCIEPLIGHHPCAASRIGVVISLGGGQVFTQFGDSGCGAAGGQRVEAHCQDAVAGVDVAAAGQRLTGQGVRAPDMARAKSAVLAV
jgi:hypothetical protein